MNILSLRHPNFIEIISFLSFPELLELPQVCRFFKNFCNKYKALIQESCLRLMGLPSYSDVFPWQKIYFQTQTKHEPTKCHFPYYTNGGTYAQSPTWFIGNLIQNQYAYCTIIPENVLVKYAFSDTLHYSYTEDPNGFRKGTNEYCIEAIESEAEENRKTLPLLKKLRIAIPKGGYTCPAKVLVCFTSCEKVEDLSLIKNFHSCNTPENAVKVAELLKIQTRLETKPDRTEIFFGESEEKVKPLYWTSINYNQIIGNRYEIEINQLYFAKYFYLLLVCAENLGTAHNIDIMRVSPYCQIVKIRE